MSWNQSGGGGKNPWGNGPGGGGPRGPWGGGPGGGQVPPDLDEMLRRAQENFRQILPGGMGPGKILAAVLGAFLVLWFSSGFYLIEPNENGVVLTFGKYVRTDEVPGLKYRLPWPIQTVDVVNVTQERRIEIGFRDTSGFGRRGVSSEGIQDVPDESLMLTGDENIIDIDFVVLWRIGSARDFLYEIRDPEDTIKKVAESAMREIIGRTKIQMALTEARGQIQDETRTLMQKMLDEYKAGVTINNVQLQKVDPPDQVVDAFNDVQRARTDMERMRNEAEAYHNDILPRARGEAEKLRQDAAGYRQKTIDLAKGDASRFDSVYAAYKTSRDVTEKRLYIETMEQVLRNAKTVVLDAGSKGGGIMPLLPLGDAARRALPAPAAPVSDGASQ